MARTMTLGFPCSAVQAIRDRDTFERLAMNNSGCGILVATVLKEPLWAAFLAYVEPGACCEYLSILL